jgi:O-antigen ligase/polysaccharide polymerase Wzy-like membrane protein
VSDELLAQIGAAVAAAGLAALLLARPRWARLAGLSAWGLGLALFLPFLLPSGQAVRLAAAGLAGLVLAAALALLFVRWPWSLAFLALAAAPARIPVSVGDTSANLLVPLYAVVAGAAGALAWHLLKGEHRARGLGTLSWPLALLVGWVGLSLAWTDDVRAGAITLFFFVLPFGVLAVGLAGLPWSPRALTGLFGLLCAMALVFAAIGGWQWLTRDVFWNPKVIVSNSYAPFYRVNSVFWDPSIYGRFLVVAILAALVLILFQALRNDLLELGLGVLLLAVWVGLFVSFSQSSFAALVAGVVLAVALAWRWRALAAVGLVAAVMIPVGMAAPQLENVRDSLFGSSQSRIDRATGNRSQLLGNGLRIAADHPVAGVGVGGFKEAYAERVGVRRAPSSVSHNTPLTIAAENGVVGLTLFLWLLAAAALTCFRGALAGDTPAAQTRLIAGVALGAILVHSLFYDALFEDPMTWGLLALAALAAGQGGEEATA